MEIEWISLLMTRESDRQRTVDALQDFFKKKDIKELRPWSDFVLPGFGAALYRPYGNYITVLNDDDDVFHETLTIVKILDIDGDKYFRVVLKTDRCSSFNPFTKAREKNAENYFKSVERFLTPCFVKYPEKSIQYGPFSAFKPITRTGVIYLTRADLEAADFRERITEIEKQLSVELEAMWLDSWQVQEGAEQTEIMEKASRARAAELESLDVGSRE